MNYEFPIIENINDVLPHIAGRPEFIVAEREYGIICNYMINMSDTFDMIDQNDLGGAIRRECRGIKFYPSGKIAARPFFKFFNINEREETQANNVDWTKPYTIMEKRDGSMIHPMLIGNEVRWMSKMGLTSVSKQVEEYIEKNLKYNDFATWCIKQNTTPIFEYTSPNNKIVVHYDKDDLVLLAVRHNITGEFLSIYP